MHNQLYNLPITLSLSIISPNELSENIAENARKHGSDMIVVSWLPPSRDGNGTTTGPIDIKQSATYNNESNNPFGALFRTSTGAKKPASVTDTQSIRRVFAQSSVDVALFVDQTASSTDLPSGTNQHIFLPFFGGPDDRLALEFVVQICESANMTATVLRMVKKTESILAPTTDIGNNDGESPRLEDASRLTVRSLTSNSMITLRGEADTSLRMQSEITDSISWTRYAEPRIIPDPTPHPLSAALSQIKFRELETSTPLRSAIQECRSGLGSTGTDEHRRLLVITGRSLRPISENHRTELDGLIREYGTADSEDMRRTIGDAAMAFVLAGCGVGVVVLQAAPIE